MKQYYAWQKNIYIYIYYFIYFCVCYLKHFCCQNIQHQNMANKAYHNLLNFRKRPDMTSRERLDLQNFLFKSLLTYNHHSEGIMRIRIGRSVMVELLLVRLTSRSVWNIWYMMYFNELHCNETSALDGLYQDQEPKQRLKVSPGGHFFFVTRS